jgi:hypothetical protein
MAGGCEVKRTVYKVQGGKLVGAKFTLSELASAPLEPAKPKRNRNPLASTHTVETLAARIEELKARLAAHTKPSPNRRTTKGALKRARQLMRALTNEKPPEDVSAG